MTLADDATAEIARFDAELGAEIAPFASVLLRSESTSSSRIEHVTSGAKSIALAELGSRERRNATEIVGTVAAMIAALELSDRLDEAALLSVHAALLAEVQPTRPRTVANSSMRASSTSSPASRATVCGRRERY